MAKKKQTKWEIMTVVSEWLLSSDDIEFYCNGDQDTDTGGWDFVSAVGQPFDGKTRFFYYFKREKQ